ncbi:hypothetical protein HRbin09_00258 [bacterium HR09]|nr:hypothetical protein HRbin09_00258 [bacterium HR09]
MKLKPTGSEQLERRVTSYADENKVVRNNNTPFLPRKAYAIDANGQHLRVEKTLHSSLPLQLFRNFEIFLFYPDKCITAVRDRYPISGLTSQPNRRFESRISTTNHEDVVVPVRGGVFHPIGYFCQFLTWHTEFTWRSPPPQGQHHATCLENRGHCLNVEIIVFNLQTRKLLTKGQGKLVALGNFGKYGRKFFFPIFRTFKP